MKKLVLVALAAATLLSAPVLAQRQFEWHAGRYAHLGRQADRWHDDIADRISRRIELAAERARRRLERTLERAYRQAERQRERTANRIRAHVAPRVGIAGTRFAGSVLTFSVEQGTFDSDPCSDVRQRDGNNSYTHCEVRDEQLPAGPLAVDARPNGGIRIEAWGGNGIRIRAVVQAHARTPDEAKQLAGRVQLQTGGGRVSASGPESSERDRREWWSVGYRINVPRQTDLELNSVNGSISIAGVSGTQRFETHNGSVTLRDLAGSVRGTTSNGSVKLALGGQRWDGEGLDVETSNGAVTVEIPDGYNAQLDTRTVNGGAHFDYPMTVVGDLTARRGISATLGSGGPTVRARTPNGRLSVERR
jgi:hypothetical protein